MSQHVFLIQYESDESKKLCEKGVVIDSAFISSDLLEELTKQWPLIELDIYEDKGLDDSYKIDCFNSELIQDICAWLESVFLRILDDASAKKAGKEKPSTSTTVSTEIITKDDLFSLIEKFRTITNLINIFGLKNNKYPNDNTAVLKLG